MPIVNLLNSLVKCFSVCSYKNEISKPTSRKKRSALLFALSVSASTEKLGFICKVDVNANESRVRVTVYMQNFCIHRERWMTKRTIRKTRASFRRK